MTSHSMSPDKPGSLDASAPLGTEITLRNERLMRVGFGVARLSIGDLAPGAYLVEFQISDTAETMSVYLPPGGKLKCEPSADFRLRAVAPVTSAGRTLSKLEQAAQHVYVDARDLPDAAEEGFGEALLLVGSSADAIEDADFSAQIELRRLVGHAVLLGVGVSAADVQPRAFRIPLPPGMYSLRFLGGSRFNERFVPIMPGRRTEIFVGYNFQRLQQQGLTPEKITLASFPISHRGFAEADRAHLEWIEIATASLARERIGFDVPALRACLDDPELDPFAALLVAAHAVTSLNRKRLPLPPEADSGRLDGASLVESLMPTVAALDLAADALERLAALPFPVLAESFQSDAVAMARWLKRNHGLECSAFADLPVKSPPLLALSFTLAVEESIDDPASMPDGTLIAAAGAVQARSAPWFSWREKIEGAKLPSKNPSRVDIDRAGRILVDLVTAVRGPASRKSSRDHQASARGIADRLRHEHGRLYQSISKILVAMDNELVDIRTGETLSANEALKRVASDLRQPAANLVRELTEVDLQAMIAEAFADQVGPLRQGAIFERHVAHDPRRWEQAYEHLIESLKAKPGYPGIESSAVERQQGPKWTLRTLQDSLVRRATGND